VAEAEVGAVVAGAAAVVEVEVEAQVVEVVAVVVEEVEVEEVDVVAVVVVEEEAEEAEEVVAAVAAVDGTHSQRRHRCSSSRRRAPQPIRRCDRCGSAFGRSCTA
jgi:hypothetical protein